MSNKRVVVTGGAGFVGSHLCQALINQGHKVICVDNYFTGSRNNLNDLDVEIIEHDVCNPLDIKADEFYNLACPASPVHYQSSPIQTTKTAVLGTLHLLEAAQKCDARLLQASTSEIYGDPEIHPQDESYWGNVNPIGIRSCYDEGKRCAETLVVDFQRYGVQTRLARIFNTYGPHMHPNDGRVVSNFILQALQNQPITVYGQGQQTRSFCFVSDLVAGLMSLMASDELGPVNLGNPAEFTILELAQMIIEMTDSKSEILYEPLPSDDPRRRKPDISKARRVLDWEPAVALKEGLEKTINYFEGVLAHS
ncbi:MAG: UDP-glucose 4-epimerase [Chlamydiales bacterium]|nr:UDP-glucose 4-epimerase [Chlamydiales bacterium]MCH9635083.1 UDP-glucose 4-epimerase [Chlamydiales bacterium]MCH9703488.1 SDR family oxidoreductase [Chlamydiota bacterium]